MKKKRKKKVKKSLYDILLAVSIIVLAVSGFLFVRTIVQRHQVKNEEKEAGTVVLLDLKQEENGAAMLSDVTREPEITPQWEEMPIPEEFRKLYETNPDFIGIVRFADMSLYVCRGRDNEYYLTHKFDGSENPAGMIFLDASCVFEAGDNFLLHGHNMDDGSRFGKLKRFKREAHLKAHPVFTFDTIRGNHEYRVTAVFEASFRMQDDNYFSYQLPRFADEAAFDAYIARAKELAFYETGFTPSYGKPLLILSTCTDEDHERLVVLCGEI